MEALYKIWFHITAGLIFCFLINRNAAVVLSEDEQLGEGHADFSKYYCSFENGDCGWSSEPARSWLVQAAGRDTFIMDHSINENYKGHFLELKKPAGKTSASFISPSIQFSSSQKCLRIWAKYYFPRNNMKTTFNINLIDGATNQSYPQFNKELLNQGHYKAFETTLKQNINGFKLQLTVEWSGFEGWLYLDDIVIYSNPCEKIPEPQCFNLTQFACKVSDKCIPATLKCNQVRDCGNEDPSDEENCASVIKENILYISIGVGGAIIVVLVIIGVVAYYCCVEKKRKEAKRRLKEKERESNFSSLDRKRLTNRYKQNSNATLLLNTSNTSRSPSRAPSMAASQGSLTDDRNEYYDTINGKRTSLPPSTIV